MDPCATIHLLKGNNKTCLCTLIFHYIVSLLLNLVFCSPGHEVLKVSYCDRYLSVICTSVSPSFHQQFLQTTSSPRPMVQFQNNFTEMFLGWSSTKIAKMVLIHWTKWLPELNIEKTFNRHLLLDQWIGSKIFSQKGFLGDPLPKLLKSFCSTGQNGCLS